MVPYKICSFDIEASSSHGDFPNPIKNFKQLAVDIYEEYFRYETIHSTNGCFFVNKPYTWLNKFRNTNKYYYCNSNSYLKTHFNIS